MFVEAALDSVPQGVDGPVHRYLDQLTGSSGYHGIAAPLFHIFTYEISIIAFIGQQDSRFWSFFVHDLLIAFVIRYFARAERVGYRQD